jgi:hypothetical protein
METLEQLRSQDPRGFRNEEGGFIGVFILDHGSHQWQLADLEGFRFAVGTRQLAEALLATIPDMPGRRKEVSNARWIDYNNSQFEKV